MIWKKPNKKFISWYRILFINHEKDRFVFRHIQSDSRRTFDYCQSHSRTWRFGRNLAGYYSAQSTQAKKQFTARLSSVGNGFSGNRRSEEHTSELQSRENLVCQLLLEKNKQTET